MATTTSVSGYSPFSLDAIAHRDSKYEIRDRLCALKILTSMLTSSKPDVRSQSLLSPTITNLNHLIRTETSNTRYQACSLLDTLFKSYFPIPTKDLNLYAELKRLIEALCEEGAPAKDQKKIALVLSTLITHILLYIQEEQEKRTNLVGIIHDENREGMKTALKQLERIKKIEKQKVKSSDDSYQIDYHIAYIREALKLLSTDKSNFDKALNAFFLVVAGVVNLADKKIVEGFGKFKAAFKLVDSKEEWFAKSFALRSLELKGAKSDTTMTNKLIQEMMASNNDFVFYQGVISLSSVALLGETAEIRNLAASSLAPLKKSKESHLVRAYVRHLSKIAKGGKTAEERELAQKVILSLEGKDAYTTGKREWVEGGLLKTIAKEKDFSEFTGENAIRMLNTSDKSMTIQKEKGNASPHNVSPEGSPPKAESSSAVRPTYRAALPAEACLARALGSATRPLGSTWDSFWKDWLAFANRHADKINSLTISGNNTSLLRLNPNSFALIALFLNEHQNYNAIDLTFSKYNADELADFLPQIDRRKEIEFVLGEIPGGEKEAEAKYIELARSLFGKGLYEVSKDLLEGAMVKHPTFGESCDFLVQLGKVYNKLNHPETESIYKKSLSINENHFATWYNYGFYYDHTNKIPESFDAWRRAIALEPNTAAGHYTLAQHLGILYEKTKERKLIEEANKEIEIAYRLDKEDVSTRRILLLNRRMMKEHN